jgi:hypothetical protein
MELHNNWMPDGDEEDVTVSSPRRWVWMLVGVIITILCLFIFESRDPPPSFDLHRRFTRLETMCLEGTLFESDIYLTDSGRME